MRPINSFEFKTRLLDERDKIPLTVPCAPYELGRERKSLFHEGQRSGIRIALRCLEQTQTLLGYEFMVMVRHGKWVWNSQQGHWECNRCGCIRSHDLVLGLDAAYCGQCGAKMDLEEDEKNATD